MRLLFVYNAEAGLVHGMLDSLHKVLSPDTYACALCQLTYGMFTMDSGWRAYLQSLPMESAFFHREDFKSAYPTTAFELPVILLESAGDLQELISATQLRSLKDVDALIALLDTVLQNVRQGS